MSARAAATKGGVLHRWLAQRVRVAGLVCVGIFLWAVAQFYSPATGFSSLISIGDALRDREVAALRAVPHYVYEDSTGYDGAYYVQLALHPALDDPELVKAIDNLPYRARRILFCWVAWTLGLGQPAWIVQAHALLNVFAWLALAWVITRWFPPTGWENFLRWVGVMFSSGVTMSVRNSLVDAPSLLLVALALAWLERGRTRSGAAMLALAGLGRETSLLAVSAFAETGDPRREAGDTRREGWQSLVSGLWSLVWRGALIALPLVAWVGYIRWKVGPNPDPGLGNFAVPLSGFAQKWGESLAEFVGHPFSPTAVTTFATVVTLTVQFLFFALRWRPAELWWRVGAAYALLMVFLATPVWEGFPGAATRVLLPMTLAFNITVPRGGRWLPVVLAGNLAVLAAYKDFTPPHEFYSLRAEGVAVSVARTGAWSGPEAAHGDEWRWSAGESGLRFHNASGAPIVLACHGQVVSAQGERHVRALLGDVLLWGETISTQPEELRFGCTLPPGDSEIRFTTDVPGRRVGADPRVLAFRVQNLEIVARPAARQR